MGVEVSAIEGFAGHWAIFNFMRFEGIRSDFFGFRDFALGFEEVTLILMAPVSFLRWMLEDPRYLWYIAYHLFS